MKKPINTLITVSVVSFFVFCLLGVSTQLDIVKKIEDIFDLKSGTLQEVVIDNQDNSGGDNTTETFQAEKYKNYSPETIEYFKEVALGREFEADGTTIIRWTTNMKIYVEGQNVPYLNDELTKIVSELNDIIDPIEIEVVTDPSLANMTIYFGSYTQFYNTKPNEDLSLLESNWGLFRVGDNYGYMYVDITRANEQEQKHLLREELTQSLGLVNDSQKYPESIFYQEWTSTTEYAPIDVELIDMLYNN